jgi:hypothetical protein
MEKNLISLPCILLSYVLISMKYTCLQYLKCCQKPTLACNSMLFLTMLNKGRVAEPQTIRCSYSRDCSSLTIVLSTLGFQVLSQSIVTMFRGGCPSQLTILLGQRRVREHIPRREIICQARFIGWRCTMWLNRRLLICCGSQVSTFD